MAASLDFDGSSDYINLGDVSILDGATQFTMMGWGNINASAASGSDSILSEGRSSGAGNGLLFCMYRSAPQIFLGMQSDSGSQNFIKTSGLSSSDNVWYHWTWTWNAATGNQLLGGSNFYQNGTSISLINHSGGTETITDVASTTKDMEIGARFGSETSSWDGQIAYVQVFERALSQSEIQCCVKDPNAVSKNRVGYWPLVTTSCKDLSGNGNDGTITGTVVASSDGPPINYSSLSGGQ